MWGGYTVRLSEVLVRDHADLHDFLVSGFGVNVQSSGFLAYGRWFLVSSFCCGVQGFWFLASALGLRVEG